MDIFPTITQKQFYRSAKRWVQDCAARHLPYVCVAGLGAINLAVLSVSTPLISGVSFAVSLAACGYLASRHARHMQRRISDFRRLYRKKMKALDHARPEKIYLFSGMREHLEAAHAQMRSPSHALARRYEELALQGDILLDDEASALSDAYGPSNRDLPPLLDLRDASSLTLRRFVEDALRADQIELIQRPIVTFQQPQQSCAVRLHARVHHVDGRAIPHDSVDMLFDDEDAGFDLTRFLLKGAVELLSEGASYDCIVPIKGRYLLNQNFMDALLAFYKVKNSRAVHALVLSLTYDDYITMPAKIMNVMHALRRLGCQFMLSDVAVDLHPSDMKHLQKLNIKMIAVSASYVAGESAYAEGFRALVALRRMLESHSIRFLVNEVSDAHGFLAIRQIGARYVSGPYFSVERESNAFKEDNLGAQSSKRAVPLARQGAQSHDISDHSDDLFSSF